MPKSPFSADPRRRQQVDACVQCRRRKIKCDAARPHCGGCVRRWNIAISTRQSPGHEHPMKSECSYLPNVQGPHAKIKELEAIVAQLQDTVNSSAAAHMHGYDGQAADLSLPSLRPTERLPVITLGKSSSITLDVFMLPGGERRIPPLYSCRAVRAWTPPGIGHEAWYRSLPFFPLAVGARYEIIQDAGWHRTMPGLATNYDRLLVARDEGDCVGWVLAAHVEREGEGTPMDVEEREGECSPPPPPAGSLPYHPLWQTMGTSSSSSSSGKKSTNSASSRMSRMNKRFSPSRSPSDSMRERHRWTNSRGTSVGSSSIDEVDVVTLARPRDMPLAPEPPSLHKPGPHAASPHGRKAYTYPDQVPTRRQASCESDVHLGANVEPGANFECTYCGEEFIKHSSFLIHFRSHPEACPYVCAVEGCDRRFFLESAMWFHARTHTLSEDESDGPP
ncbi:hypothetical protein FA95DRAFT_226559 [Auriscalpium vulgare]|uniref:Uncharacterized protein n=1 Tax=Auriscalpium vulgare TaxID=40419 RepID=A0ACB8RKK9_9AGAM|nr:hypothetical protein FA95DRAFT_226559 [Auriscalpium vulgare]